MKTTDTDLSETVRAYQALVERGEIGGACALLDHASEAERAAILDAEERLAGPPTAEDRATVARLADEAPLVHAARQRPAQ